MKIQGTSINQWLGGDKAEEKPQSFFNDLLEDTGNCT